MRAIVTGQVGMEKKDYLQTVVRLAAERGEQIEVLKVVGNKVVVHLVGATD